MLHAFPDSLVWHGTLGCIRRTEHVCCGNLCKYISLELAFTVSWHWLPPEISLVKVAEAKKLLWRLRFCLLGNNSGDAIASNKFLGNHRQPASCIQRRKPHIIQAPDSEESLVIDFYPWKIWTGCGSGSSWLPPCTGGRPSWLPIQTGKARIITPARDKIIPFLRQLFCFESQPCRRMCSDSLCFVCNSSLSHDHWGFVVWLE